MATISRRLGDCTMTTKQTGFNQLRSIKSELSSEQERADKIIEMNKRGFIAVRTWEREVVFNDWVATGYHQAKVRCKGQQANMKYGVMFRRIESVEGETR